MQGSKQMNYMSTNLLYDQAPQVQLQCTKAVVQQDTMMQRQPLAQNLHL